MMFDFKIYMQGHKYVIQAETVNRTPSAEEKIIWPYGEYQKVYSKYLENDHSQIFDYIWVSKLSGNLELIGLPRKYV